MERSELSNYRLKTKSIWGSPHEIFYRFLRRIEDRHLPKTLAILGCSDGTYAIPAAKRGFEVLAMDIDEVSLYGGTTMIGEKNVAVDGLVNRLKVEELEDLVTVIGKDYMTYTPQRGYSGVYTSGSIHYEDNFKYSLTAITDRIKDFVANEGLLLLEYIHISEDDNNPLKHFVTGKQLANYFSGSDFKITSNKKKVYVEEPNPRNPLVHGIVWGRLYAERRRMIYHKVI